VSRVFRRECRCGPAVPDPDSCLLQRGDDVITGTDAGMSVTIRHPRRSLRRRTQGKRYAERTGTNKCTALIPYQQPRENCWR
jgi:hypothetical protein